MKYRLLKEAALQNLIEEDIPYDYDSVEDDEDMEDTGPIDSNLDGIISRIRKEHNVGIFKPGYPTAIDEYMILSKDKKQVLELLSEYGLSAKPLSGVGYDYNYGGSLWKIKAGEDEPKGVKTFY